MTKSPKALSFRSPTGAVQQTNKTTNVPHYGPAEISKEKIPKGLEENRDIARKGGNAAKKARLEIEK